MRILIAGIFIWSAAVLKNFAGREEEVGTLEIEEKISKARFIGISVE